MQSLRKDRYCPRVESDDANYTRYVHNDTLTMDMNYTTFKLYCEQEFNVSTFSDGSNNTYTCLTVYYLPFFKQCVFSKTDGFHEKVDWFNEQRTLETYCYDLNGKYSKDSCFFNKETWKISAAYAVLQATQ